MDDAATTPADVSPKDDNSTEDTGVLEKKKEDNPAMDDAETLPSVKEDPILDYAIHYAINNAYPPDLTKEKKRAVRKRAATLTIDSGDVFLKRKNKGVTATALLNGVHPGECTFNQSRMRKHLYDCLNKGNITQFPLLKRRRGGRKIKYSETFSVYCDCRMPECSERDMVECSVSRMVPH